MAVQRDGLLRGAKIGLGAIVVLLGVVKAAPLWCFLASLVWPLRFHAAAIEGRVVDADTSVPIESAHVLAVWDLGNIRGDNVKCAHLADAVTSRDGRFVIESWDAWRWPPWVHMRPFAPKIYVFKRDYMPLVRSHRLRSGWHTAWDSDLNGASIRLAPVADVEAYGKTVEGVLSGLGWKKNCDWTKWRRFSMAMREALDAVVRAKQQYPFRYRPSSLSERP